MRDRFHHNSHLKATSRRAGEKGLLLCGGRGFRALLGVHLRLKRIRLGQDKRWKRMLYLCPCHSPLRRQRRKNHYLVVAGKDMAVGLGSMVFLLSSKLRNDVPLQAIRKQCEAGRERKEPKARNYRASCGAAGERDVNESSQGYP